MKNLGKVSNLKGESMHKLNESMQELKKEFEERFGRYIWELAMIEYIWNWFESHYKSMQEEAVREFVEWVKLSHEALYQIPQMQDILTNLLEQYLDDIQMTNDYPVAGSKQDDKEDKE